MVFNSYAFLGFFVVVFAVYYFVMGKNGRLQNLWLLMASYVFYGIAEWRMVPLLAIVTLAFYGIGIAIEKQKRYASALTAIGVCLGVGLLLYFKYLNFFILSFKMFFDGIGLHTNMTTFNIIMPLGISFFTFKLIAYVVEIHRQHIAAERNLVDFGIYVAFFPTILSGPIDRPAKFLPQLKATRHFDYDMAMDGFHQILWGMLKKIVVADNFAFLVNDLWNGGFNATNSAQLWLGFIAYPMYLYMDFSGYSDIAIGVGKLLGIRVAVNFKYPFFGRNVAEYWRGWHMSLTQWLTDYVFMPLSVRFRDYGKTGLALAIIINMVLVGMWHGAGFNYALFGLYHGLLFVPLIISGSFMRHKKLKTNSHDLPLLKDAGAMLLTYMLVAIGHVLFAAPSVSEAYGYYVSMFTNWDVAATIGWHRTAMSLVISGAITAWEWKARKHEYALQSVTSRGNARLSLTACYVVIAFIVLLGAFEDNQFVYFQF